MSNKYASKLKAQTVLELTAEQKDQSKEIVDKWSESGGMIIGSAQNPRGEMSIGLRIVPEEIGRKLIKLVDDYYANSEGDNNA